ncbi:MAG: alpha/beta hydrolase [Planctomycetes bacterium]|nr:alpha/beta hydrolase [Planctomycetota bacterium]
MLTFLLVPAGLYVLWIAALYLLQDRLVFPRQMVPGGHRPAPRGAETLVHEAGPGRRTGAFFARAPDGPARAPAVVFFHGNAERAEDQEWLVDGYHRLGWSVLLVEYPGYGSSTGKPSQASIREDALGFWRLLPLRADIDPRRIVLHGRSIGGGVAADLAAELSRRGDPLPAGLVLQSTPESVASLANRYGAPSFLVRSPYRTGEALRSVDLPVLFLHGRYDRLAPIAGARRLAALCPRSRLLEYDTGHNGLPSGAQFEDFWREIAAFLSSLPAGSR